MPPRKVTNLVFPLGGLDRSVSYNQQPPYTTPDCLNVRPRDAFKRRMRGGSRPGLGKAYGSQIGNGDPIRLLNSLTVAADDGFRHWTDYFEKSTLGNQWEEAEWIGESPDYFPWDTSNLEYKENAGLVLKKMTYLDSMPYSIGILITPWKNKHHGSYSLYARLNDDNPDPTQDGIEAKLVLSGNTGEYSGSLIIHNGGEEGETTEVEFSTGEIGFAAAGWFTLYINGDNLTCTFYGKQLISQSIAGTLGSNAGTRFAFSMNCTNAGGICLVDGFRVQYYVESSVPKTRTFLVASSGGKLYVENVNHEFDEVESEIILSSDRLLQSAERCQKLYIADGLYPKVYDGPSGLFTELRAGFYDDGEPKGEVPQNCELVCVYRDRLVFAHENTWFMSRDGDPTDWDYGIPGDDVGRAVAGMNSDAGEIGEFITALIPHNDDYLVFGCSNSLWVLRGDPGYDGQIDNLSREVGIIGPSAWCKSPVGEIVFLSRDGLYVLSPGAESPPTPLSRTKLPQELLDIDPDLYTVTMAYDIRDQGIHLYVTPEDPKGNMYHWWIDWEYKSFWPMDTNPDYEPTALYSFKSNIAAETAVLLGSRDGYIRRYFQSLGTDEGDGIKSYVVYGPISLGGSSYMDGTLAEISCTLGARSGGVYWFVHVADSAELTLDAQTIARGLWRSGVNLTNRPMARGAYMNLLLHGSYITSPWAVEEINAVIQRNGRRRAG